MPSVFVSPLDYIANNKCQKIVFKIGKKDYVMWCNQNIIDTVYTIVGQVNTQYHIEEKKHTGLENEDINVIAAIETINNLHSKHQNELEILKKEITRLQKECNDFKEKEINKFSLFADDADDVKNDQLYKEEEVIEIVCDILGSINDNL